MSRLGERLGPGADYLDVFGGAFEVGGSGSSDSDGSGGLSVIASAGRERDNGSNKGDELRSAGTCPEYRWRGLFGSLAVEGWVDAC